MPSSTLSFSPSSSLRIDFLFTLPVLTTNSSLVGVVTTPTLVDVDDCTGEINGVSGELSIQTVGGKGFGIGFSTGFVRPSSISCT